MYYVRIFIILNLIKIILNFLFIIEKNRFKEFINKMNYRKVNKLYT